MSNYVAKSESPMRTERPRSFFHGSGHVCIVF
jgi:hypothetical protein